MFYCGKVFSLNAFNLKHLTGCVSVCDSKYLAPKRERGYKHQIVNEREIFPSVTESKEITISKVVEQLVPEEGEKRK